MFKRLRRALSPSMAVALLALFVHRASRNDCHSQALGVLGR
jgi:hypothetical protein